MTSVAFADVVSDLHRDSQIAQVCASLGWRIFPVIPGTKRPAIKAWQVAASSDGGQVWDWWGGSHPGHLVGIATGSGSGIWVTDIDVKHVNGMATVRDLFGAHGMTHRPATLVVRTPSGGEHWYWRYPTDGREIRNTASTPGRLGPLGPGVESRGRHGYVIAPFTRVGHGAYEVIDNHAPIPAPPWLEDLVERRPTATSPPVGVATADAAVVAQVAANDLSLVTAGGRNHALNDAAFRLGLFGAIGVLDRDSAWSALHHACEVNGLVRDDGLDQCRATFDSGWDAGLATGDQP